MHEFLLIIPAGIFAVLSVTLRNIFYSALSLVFALFFIALIYLDIGSGLLFAVQIVIYVGGIAVLILFIIMLAGNPYEYLYPQHNKLVIPAAIIAVAIFCLLSYASFNIPIPSKIFSIKTLSKTLLEYIVSFEAVTLLIFSSIAGVVLFTKK